MKSIIYNDNNLTDSDVSKVVGRAKAIIVNDNDEILLACVNSNYHFPGGHLEENETYEECLKRELKEELGIDIPLKEREPLISIIYYSKDYPNVGSNTKYVGNFYEIKESIKPNMDNVHLTEEEQEGGFHIEYIKSSEIINFLEEALKVCTRPNVIKDTLEVAKEYLNERGNL